MSAKTPSHKKRHQRCGTRITDLNKEYTEVTENDGTAFGSAVFGLGSSDATARNARLKSAKSPIGEDLDAQL
jgi:hypothetical protein